MLNKEKKQKKIPRHILKYQERNHTNVFVYTRPIRRGPKQKDNEFADLWLRNIYLKTEFVFPSIYRRSEVLETIIQELNPLVNAINNIETKTSELNEILENLERMISYKEEISIAQLSMTLNGVIDAAINGGISKYRDAFLISKESDEMYSEESKERLRLALLKQLNVIQDALMLHSKLCSPELRGLQEKMEDFYLKLKREMVSCCYKEKKWSQ